MKSAFSLVVLASMSYLLSACSNTSTNPLLSSEPSTTTTASIDKTANSSQLSLTCDSGSITMPRDSSGNPATQVEVSGTCYVSTFPTHNIKAYWVNPNSSAVTSELTVLSVQGDAYGRCINGRYSIILNAAQLVSGMNTVKMILTAFDSSGNQVTNGSGASRTINIIK